MKIIRIVMDHVLFSINEILDLFLHSILFSYVVVYAFGGAHDIGYAFFFVVPGFILFAPLIKNLHKRHIVEWIIKVPTYVIVGFAVFLLSYGIIGTNVADAGRTGGGWTFLIIALLIETYWAYRSLKRLSKPPLAWEERRARTRKRSFVSINIALGSASVSVIAFGMTISPPEQTGDFDVLGTFIIQLVTGFVGLAAGVFALIMFFYSFFSILDRT